MIDVSEVITDPDFCQDIPVLRSTGDFVKGRWVENAKTPVTLLGVITPMSAKELQQLPEADRVIGSINIYTIQPIYLTSGDNPKRTSDQVLWKGHYHKVVQVNDYSDHGFYYGIGQRITGD